MNATLFRIAPIALAGALVTVPSAASAQHAVRRTIDGRPDATIDLRTDDGAALVRAQWRYRDARPIEISANAPGPDLKPFGSSLKTLDQAVRAGGREFDDSGWEAIQASSLDRRRSTSRQSFAWYRVNVTIPERVAAISTRGTTAVFELSLIHI